MCTGAHSPHAVPPCALALSSTSTALKLVRKNPRSPVLRAAYAASSWARLAALRSCTLTAYSSSSSSTVSRLASGMWIVPLTAVAAASSPSNPTASQARVMSKSKPWRGWPRTTTTVASPVKVFTAVTVARAPTPPAGMATHLPTTISVTRAVAHPVWPRSSHVPALFQLLRPPPAVPSNSFASKTAASASVSFMGTALGAVPWLACSCQ
mmetsp:Transcript_27942/g.44791  ORF Transcript_27942/g.44791 Transcript_27942/m.44791 type:complete len:210 (-) Transcript_27942:587-1216(-)